MLDSATTRSQVAPLRGGWWWLGCFQFFVAEQVTRLGWRGPYSMARNYISDLGKLQCSASACSTWHWLMNGSFFLQGVLIATGAFLLRRVLPRRLWILFAVAGLGVLVVGLVSEDGAARLHYLGAAANFLGGNLGMISVGFVWTVLPGRSASQADAPEAVKTGRVALLAGAVGLLATVTLASGFHPLLASAGLQAGTLERLAAYPLPLWLTWTGFRMVTAGRSATNL